MTTIPQPADPTQSFTGTYDAWNRLVKLEDGSGTVAQYEYDGAKRRTVKKTYTSGTLTETRHFYYTEPSRWQVVEERVESSSDAERQFVWGLRYIDDIVLRDRDTNDDGTLDERLYGLQDANWNVTSCLGSAAIAERYAYTAYGQRTILSGSFVSRANSQFNWNLHFAGYTLDEQSLMSLVRHRYYDRYMGVWLQRDPIGRDKFGSLYQYGLSAPTDYTDSTGLNPTEWSSLEDCHAARDWLDCVTCCLSTYNQDLASQIVVAIAGFRHCKPDPVTGQAGTTSPWGRFYRRCGTASRQGLRLCAGAGRVIVRGGVIVTTIAQGSVDSV